MIATPRSRQETVAGLREIGIIPVIRADSTETAARIVDTLV